MPSGFLSLHSGDGQQYAGWQERGQLDQVYERVAVPMTVFEATETPFCRTFEREPEDEPEPNGV
jgi:hypothetical protein